MLGISVALDRGDAVTPSRGVYVGRALPRAAERGAAGASSISNSRFTFDERAVWLYKKDTLLKLSFGER